MAPIPFGEVSESVVSPEKTFLSYVYPSLREVTHNEVFVISFADGQSNASPIWRSLCEDVW